MTPPIDLRLGKVFLLFLIIPAGLLTAETIPAHAVFSSANAVTNNSFEDGLNGWGTWMKHGGFCCITTNNTRAVTGLYSAKLDIGRIPIGFLGLFQVFPPNTLFSNLTDRPDGVDLWFWLDPKYDGLGDFQIIFLAQNAQEMRYVFDAEPRLGYPNQTFPIEPVVYDLNRNSVYDAGENVIAGFTPAVGASLKDDPKILYVDRNSTGFWEQGESVVYDRDGSRFFNTGEPRIAGPLTDAGAPLSDDPAIKYSDDNGVPVSDNNNVWDIRPNVKVFQRGSTRAGESPVYGPGEWHRFTANVKADWQAPMMLSDGTILPGYSLNEEFYRIELDAIAFQDTITGGSFSEIVWVDDVKVYWDADVPPPPPPELHSANFTFTDMNGNNVDSKVRWRLFNTTGEVPYTLGQRTLPSGTYTVEAYYPTVTASPETYRIHRETIVLDETTTIRLPMIPHASAENGYIAFSDMSVSVTISRQDASLLVFTAVSNSADQYSIIVTVSRKPAVIQRNDLDLTEGPAWSYDSELSTVRIRNTLGANYALFFDPPPRLPRISFVNNLGQAVDSIIYLRILDPNKTIIGPTKAVEYTPGMIVPVDSYTIEAYYEGYRIYRGPLLLTEASTIRLEMIPISLVQGGYLAFNSTVSVDLLEQTNSRIRFNVGGQGPLQIVTNVPRKPLYVERNGLRIVSWVYNDTSKTVRIDTETAGTFSIVFERPSSVPVLYMIAGSISLAALATAPIAFWWRRRNSKRSTSPIGDPPSNSTQKQYDFDAGSVRSEAR